MIIGAANTEPMEKMMENLECIPALLVIILLFLVILVFMSLRDSEQKKEKSNELHIEKTGIIWHLMDNLEEERKRNKMLQEENRFLKEKLFDSSAIEKE